MSIALARNYARSTLHPVLSLSFAVGFAVVAFGSSLLDLISRWNVREEYSHGYLIPLVSAWLLWTRRDALVANLGPASWAGVGVVAAALLLNVVGALTAIFLLAQVGFVLSLAGLALGLGGWRLLKAALIPIAFLLFAIPLPYFVDYIISVRLQFLSSELAGTIIRLFAIAVYIDGNVIDLGNYKLQVVDACSGLRYLFPLMSVGFLAAYLYQSPLWQRALVFVSTIPITILMNSFRIGVVGVLTNYWGTSMAEGALHLFEGWIIFIACAGLLLGELYLLARFVEQKPLFDLVGLPPLIQSYSVPDVQRHLSPLVASIALLAGGGGLVLHLAAQEEIVPERARFVSFPSTVGEWRGRLSMLEPQIEQVLGADDYLLADYKKEESKSVKLYVAFYASQRKGSSPHSPLMCIPGGGWLIANLERTIYSEDEIKFPLNRVVIERGREKQLVYYWFEQRGRRVANEWLSKWYLLADALSMQRSDISLVRFTTAVYPDETEAHAEKRIRSFFADISPALSQYLPGRGAQQARGAVVKSGQTS